MAHDDVTELRREIDALDDAIAALVVQRQDVSREIQLLRQAGGGGPIDPTREGQIRARYTALLADKGDAVARAVLSACRPDPGETP